MEKFGPPKKKMEKKSELTPPVESVFWTCFFLFPCVRDVSFFVGRNNGCVDQIAWELSSIGLGRKIIAILRLKRIRWMNSIENQTS